jgi:hypothetical protein
MPDILDLYADLSLSFNGESFKVEAEGNKITVIFPSFRGGMKFLLRTLQDPYWAACLRKMDVRLCNLYFTLFVRAGKIHFAFLGMKANANILTFLLGVYGVRRSLLGS